jgi:hypothetical protein
MVSRARYHGYWERIPVMSENGAYRLSSSELSRSCNQPGVLRRTTCLPCLLDCVFSPQFFSDSVRTLSTTCKVFRLGDCWRSG